MIEGAGQGIWEDNKRSFLMHLRGEIDKDSKKKAKIGGTYLPFNFECKKYGDFDFPPGLVKLNKELGGKFVSACHPFSLSKK